jgi:hypothetical protein
MELILGHGEGSGGTEMRGYVERELEQVKEGDEARCQVSDGDNFAFESRAYGVCMVSEHRGAVLAFANEAGIVYEGCCRLPKPRLIRDLGRNQRWDEVPQTRQVLEFGSVRAPY